MDRFVNVIKNILAQSPGFTLLSVAILFFVLGYMGSNLKSNEAFSSFMGTSSAPTRLIQTKFPLINPLLLCNVDRMTDSVDQNLKIKISNFINERVGKGKATSISVYLQEYGVGKWVGVNENIQYDPASLLKVPLMIAYYQASESKPSILSEVISFTGDDQNSDEYFKAKDYIKPHVNYTVDHLIESMIINSDNTAITLLSNNIDKNTLFTVYTDLGLPTPPNNPTVEYISAKSYAYFFRILYNATYLNRADSQKALDLLSKGHLPNGIASAVPKDVVVADKFGERSVYTENHALISRELHDCGIVYVPGKPYLLCVMTKGDDFEELSQIIHDISALVYSHVLSE